jgi:hypothetical protein
LNYIQCLTKVVGIKNKTMTRKIQFISTSLNLDKVALEDKLEKQINSDKPIGEAVEEIKETLDKIGKLNVAMGTWEQYVKEITKVTETEPEDKLKEEE